MKRRTLFKKFTPLLVSVSAGAFPIISNAKEQSLTDRAPSLSDYKDLLNYSGPAVTVRVVGRGTSDGKEGVFQYNALAPNRTNGGTAFAHVSGVGAWMRQFVGGLHSSWFGAVSGRDTSASAELQALFDAAAGGLAIIDPGVYRCTSSLILRGDLSAHGAVLNFFGAKAGGAVNACVYQVEQGNIDGLQINAAGVSSCCAGVWVNADLQQKRPCKYNLTIKNVSNNDKTQPAYGFILVRSSNSNFKDGDYDIRVSVENIQAAANGRIGDAGGAARGIGVSFNARGCTPRVRIHDSLVNGVKSGSAPFGEDADGIGIIQVDHAEPGAGGSYLIENCVVNESMGRGYKIQAPNTTLDNCISRGRCLESFSTYSPNTSIKNSKSYNSGAACISVNGDGCIISEFYGDSVGFAPLRIYATANNTKISGGTFIYRAPVTFDKTLRACMFAANTVSVSNSVFKNTSGQGTGIRALGAIKLNISDCDFKDLEYGVSFDASCIGVALIENSFIDVSNDGLICFGNFPLTVAVKKTKISAGRRGINLYSSGGLASAAAHIENCTVSAGADGITSGQGSLILNNKINSTATRSDSHGISLKGHSEASGNTVGLFKYNYVYEDPAKFSISRNISISAVETGYFRPGEDKKVKKKNLEK
ncbi:NosD domain-containing protein [Variovorax sp. 38R]|uniref:NosD domain-containing protein n=1 Tax=Variovorax sp. 38R TaxID=2774875 RepID=UPI001780D2AD|nr:NosD domain-containing protein [Variovorax sp. 38R]QOF79667.1 hypothetical protein IG196_04520 [Variovorax sp. 38R]